MPLQIPSTYPVTGTNQPRPIAKRDVCVAFWQTDKVDALSQYNTKVDTYVVNVVKLVKYT